MVVTPLDVSARNLISDPNEFFRHEEVDGGEKVEANAKRKTAPLSPSIFF